MLVSWKVSLGTSWRRPAFSKPPQDPQVQVSGSSLPMFTAAAFFMNSVVKCVIPLAAALPPATEANPLLKDVNPLKFMPSSLGIPAPGSVWLSWALRPRGS